MDTIEAIDIQIVDEEKHETLVIQKLLESLQAEFVKVVVNVDNIHLGHCMFFQKLQHLLWMDQTSQVED